MQFDCHVTQEIEDIMSYLFFFNADDSETEMEAASEDTWSAKGTGDVILPNSVDKMARLLDQVKSAKLNILNSVVYYPN